MVALAKSLSAEQLQKEAQNFAAPGLQRAFSLEGNGANPVRDFVAHLNNGAAFSAASPGAARAPLAPAAI